MIHEQYRQGDVLLVRVASLPCEAKPEPARSNEDLRELITGLKNEIDQLKAYSSKKPRKPKG